MKQFTAPCHIKDKHVIVKSLQLMKQFIETNIKTSFHRAVSIIDNLLLTNIKEKIPRQNKTKLLIAEP